MEKVVEMDVGIAAAFWGDVVGLGSWIVWMGIYSMYKFSCARRKQCKIMTKGSERLHRSASPIKPPAVLMNLDSQLQRPLPRLSIGAACRAKCD